MFALVGSGYCKDFNEAVRMTNAPVQIAEPEPKQSAKLRERFERFQELDRVLSQRREFR
ncbi:hypothetical protein VIBNISOn1_520003 [Vibrio nigripulchritudo SOn1]|uniref:Uncharacterized protein n=1 Tax=Vibrio nigripulchritudo SOn1 TaxID=1238450 RepID=A0AAV2VVF2_9VIBR|nr:hypothetical protein VIBNISOn1_520003 [Vibrio nigripulchritudo SOn1]